MLYVVKQIMDGSVPRFIQLVTLVINMMIECMLPVVSLLISFMVIHHIVQWLWFTEIIMWMNLFLLLFVYNSFLGLPCAWPKPLFKN